SGWLAGLPESAAVLFTGAAFAFLAGGMTAAVLAVRRNALPACATLNASTLVALLLCVPAVQRAEAQIVRSGSGRELAQRLSGLASDGRPIVGVHCFLRALSFYTGRRMILADFYEPDVTYARHLAGVDVHGPAELRALL